MGNDVLRNQLAITPISDFLISEVGLVLLELSFRIRQRGGRELYLRRERTRIDLGHQLARLDG